MLITLGAMRVTVSCTRVNVVKVSLCNLLGYGAGGGGHSVKKIYLLYLP